MLGLRFDFIEHKRRVKPLLPPSFFRPLTRAAALLLLSLFLQGGFAASTLAQTVRLKTPKGEIAELSSSGPQRKQGDLYSADGDVDIIYGELRLRADHVQYNTATSEAVASGHVQFDYQNQHIDCDSAQLNVQTGHGTFHNVRGFVKLERRPNPTLLITQNPLYFQADEVVRLNEERYDIHHGWMTICDPLQPTWQFYAPNAKLRLGKQVALVNANFRLYRVPLVWLPYATTPAGNRVRQTGFLIPNIGQSNSKGFVLGEALYLAPKQWFDATLGFEYFSKRGTAQRGEIRARPFENTSIKYTYFGVIDHGYTESNGTFVRQGGHQQQAEIQSLWNDGWRFVADVNQLSSLTFRLAFSDTYGDAINSEIRSSVFLTNNFRGFSFNVATLNDRSFITINPETSVVLRNAPEVRFDSVEQAPWRRVPVYFSFDSFAGAVHRDDPLINTPNFVTRTEIAPKVTIPLHIKNWLGVTGSAAFRATYYGDSQNSSGMVTGNSISRYTGEFAVELAPPTLQRYFNQPSKKRRFKHTIEPSVAYRYVTGVNNFGDFIRFDSNATLTDTNELQYGVMQRLWVKTGDDQPLQFASWNIFQKHYYDPTFGGAIVNGQRNVFQALDSVTPFAFTSGPRNWSPLVSDIKITPGGKFDAESIIEYDPQLQKVSTIGTLVKVKPYSEFFATIAHFRLQGDPIAQPQSNQIRALLGYGEMTRKGFNAAAGVSYDIVYDTLQNQFVQASYNGGCCGLAFEYRRINLGQVRTENQFRVTFIIANIGSFGNLRRREKLF